MCTPLREWMHLSCKSACPESAAAVQIFPSFLLILHQTKLMLHPPPPTLSVPACTAANPRNKKKCSAALVVWFRPPPRRLNYVVLPQNYDVIEQDGKKKGPLFLAFTYIRNHCICLEDPSQNDEKEAECLWTRRTSARCGENCEMPKLPFDIFFFSLRFNLPSCV